MNKPKVVAIIQARMQSTRLPGKVLLPLAGHSVLWWLVKRVSLATLVDRIIIATTINPANDPILRKATEEMLSECCIYRYSGEEDDVIGRVISAAKYSGADIIVDITGDCPMVDPRHIDACIRGLDDLHDYTSNDVIFRSWPDGLDVQAYWTKALEKCIEKFNPKQHAGWNIGSRYEHFRCRSWPAPPEFNWAELGLTLDTPEDYELLKILFELFGKDPGFSAESVIRYLRHNPQLIAINSSVRRKAPEEG